jgi:hypothetical protein
LTARARVATAIVCAVAMLVAPLGTTAQQTGRVARIGFLSWEGCPGRDSVFGKALREPSLLARAEESFSEETAGG